MSDMSRRKILWDNCARLYHLSEAHDQAVIVPLIGQLALSPSRAADSPSKAVFAYGAINAYMTSTWVARDKGFFRKHNVEIEPVFIIATQAAQAMLPESPVRIDRADSRRQCVSCRGRHGDVLGNQTMSDTRWLLIRALNGPRI